MSDEPITGLTIEVRKTADGQLYQYGVWHSGAFVVIAQAKTGGIDDDIARAAEAATHTEPPASA